MSGTAKRYTQVELDAAVETAFENAVKLVSVSAKNGLSALDAVDVMRAYAEAKKTNAGDGRVSAASVTPEGASFYEGHTAPPWHVETLTGATGQRRCIAHVSGIVAVAAAGATLEDLALAAAAPMLLAERDALRAEVERLLGVFSVEYERAEKAEARAAKLLAALKRLVVTHRLLSDALPPDPVLGRADLEADAADEAIAEFERGE